MDVFVDLLMMLQEIASLEPGCRSTELAMPPFSRVTGVAGNSFPLPSIHDNWISRDSDSSDRQMSLIPLPSYWSSTIKGPLLLPGDRGKVFRVKHKETFVPQSKFASTEIFELYSDLDFTWEIKSYK